MILRVDSCGQDLVKDIAGSYKRVLTVTLLGDDGTRLTVHMPLEAAPQFYVGAQYAMELIMLSKGERAGQ